MSAGDCRQAPWQLAFTSFALLDVARLCMCSKAARSFCIERLSERDQEHARQLLLDAVHAVGDQDLPTETRMSIQWLLNTAIIPPKVMALDSAKYISIPNVYVIIIRQLTAAGVRVTYEALATAARGSTAGLTDWLEACEEADVPLQLHEVTVAVCCGHEVRWDGSWPLLSRVLLRSVRPASTSHGLLHCTVAVRLVRPVVSVHSGGGQASLITCILMCRGIRITSQDV